MSAKGDPDVAPVGFGVDGDDVVVGGLDLTKTRKYYNVKATGHVASLRKARRCGSWSQVRRSFTWR